METQPTGFWPEPRENPGVCWENMLTPGRDFVAPTVQSENWNHNQNRTTCRCGWSNRCCPAGCPAAGTTASPPHWSTFLLGWTWLWPNLKDTKNSGQVRAEPEPRTRIRTRTGGELTKVGQLELPSLVDQQVLGLQVSVENFPLVAVGQTAEQLEEKQLRQKDQNNELVLLGLLDQTIRPHLDIVNMDDVSTVVQVLLQIFVLKFKNPDNSG